MCEHTVCPISSYPFHIVRYYIKWVTISLTHSITSSGIIVSLVGHNMQREREKTIVELRKIVKMNTETIR